MTSFTSEVKTTLMEAGTGRHKLVSFDYDTAKDHDDVLFISNNGLEMACSILLDRKAELVIIKFIDEVWIFDRNGFGKNGRIVGISKEIPKEVFEEIPGLIPKQPALYPLDTYKEDAAIFIKRPLPEFKIGDKVIYKPKKIRYSIYDKENPGIIEGISNNKLYVFFESKWITEYRYFTTQGEYIGYKEEGQVLYNI
jgi:hypothetical protein